MIDQYDFYAWLRSKGHSEVYIKMLMNLVSKYASDDDWRRG